MRVLILEDDPWIADLLKQIVLSLRPHAQVDVQARVDEAIAAWQQAPAQLVIADWNLPDGSGTRLLQTIRNTDRRVPLVMVTARADRNSVLEVRPLSIDAFISKPFQVPKVLDCLQRLLPSADAPASDAQQPGDFAEHLAALPGEALALPLHERLYQQLREQMPNDLRQLDPCWQQDPAVQAQLIAAANSSTYNNAGQPCVSLAGALQRLGTATALNLILGLALRPAASLTDTHLQTLGQQHLQALWQLQRRVGELAAVCRLDPAPLQSAALLRNSGELALLLQAQLWRQQGQALTEEHLQQALQRCSSELAHRIKVHWRLPNPLRELIGACYGLAPGNNHRAPILMRLACVEQQHSDSPELQRLRRLSGLS